MSTVEADRIPRSSFAPIIDARRDAPLSQAKRLYYGSYLGPKLRELFEQCRRDSQECIDVTDELASLRMNHALTMDLANTLVETANEIKDNPIAAQTMIMSAVQLIDKSANSVITAAEKAAKIMNQQTDAILPGTLDLITRQVCSFVYRIFDGETPEAKERIRKFDEALTKELNLPTVKLGTSITPDQQVLAMDSCIPFVDPSQVIDMVAS